MGLGVLSSLLVCLGAENPTPSGLSGWLGPPVVLATGGTLPLAEKNL